MKTKALVLFTKDLRIQDNPLLEWVASHDSLIVGCGAFMQDGGLQKKYFYNQSMMELKNQFDRHKLKFLLLGDDDPQTLARAFQSIQADLLLLAEPWNHRDQKRLDDLKTLISPERVIVLNTQTLLSDSAAQSHLLNFPQTFTQFKNRLTFSHQIAEPVVTKLEGLSSWASPSLQQENVHNLKPTPLPYGISPGEESAHLRLQNYILNPEHINNYKTTRNGLLAQNDSSKISPHLAVGTISVRTIFKELIKFEAVNGRNDSTQWYVQELLWRDYFKLLSKKIGGNLFSPLGLREAPTSEWNINPEQFQKWMDGTTGNDFVDANMRELKSTGWMSNRGRQNVASFLAKHLCLDWTLGAQYFESQIIDNDVENNWGNWLYLAGVGTDPRNRVFNIDRQAEMYDENKAYRRKWLSSPNET